MNCEKEEDKLALVGKRFINLDYEYYCQCSQELQWQKSQKIQQLKLTKFEQLASYQTYHTKIAEQVSGIKIRIHVVNKVQQIYTNPKPCLNNIGINENREIFNQYTTQLLANSYNEMFQNLDQQQEKRLKFKELHLQQQSMEVKDYQNTINHKRFSKQFKGSNKINNMLSKYTKSETKHFYEPEGKITFNFESMNREIQHFIFYLPFLLKYLITQFFIQ